MKDIVSCFDELIATNLKLEQIAGRWQVKEAAKGAAHTLLEITGGRSVAFSLDRSGFDAFPFMKSNTLLSGMRSVCDAIVIAQMGGVPLVAMIEMKSDNEGEAEKQLQRAHVFVKWLGDLLKLNGHCEMPKMCGVISFKPRRQARKGTTTRNPMPSPVRGAGGFPVFRLRNHPKLHLGDLAEAMKKAA